jgi:hypothetical protein
VSKNTNNKKSIFNKIIVILSAVLAVVVICDVVWFSYLRIQQTKREEILAAAVDTAVESCLTTLDKYGLNETQQEYISTYQENMQNSKTVYQRAYFADAMLTYAVNATNYDNSTKVSEAYNGGPTVQSKEYLVSDLRSALQTLQTAIYDYTLYEEE